MNTGKQKKFMRLDEKICRGYNKIIKQKVVYYDYYAFIIRVSENMPDRE